MAKIQDAGLNGQKNTGSSRETVEYLGHEDKERKEAGKEVVPFTTADGQPVNKEEVIDHIDRNHSHLGKNDTKFLHLVVAPSAKEILAMGKDEQEVYRSSLRLIKRISDAYAKNFHREGIEDSSNLVIYWKAHFSREKDGLQNFHLHAVISRKSKPKGGGVPSVKLNPMTNHKKTDKGPINGGFDRSQFYAECENIFDEEFDYKREVNESFAYKNAMSHGSLEEKSAQTELLVKEQVEKDAQEISAGIARRKKTLRDRKEVAEIAQALSMGHADCKADPLTEAFDRADLKTRIIHIFEAAESQDALDLGLLSLGATCKTRIGQLGGVEEIIVIHRGVKINTADIMTPAEHNRILLRWETLTRQTLEYKLRARQERTQQKPSQVPPRALKIGRGR